MSLASQGSLIEQLDSVPAIWDAATRALAAAGLPHIIYNSADSTRRKVDCRTTMPALYRDRDPGQDPFLDHCCNSYSITLTGVSYSTDYPYLAPHMLDFINMAGQMGFRSGFGIPMRLVGSGRYGGFNIGADVDRTVFDAKFLPRAEEFRFFCLLIHRRLEELSGPEPSVTEFRPLMIAPKLSGLTSLSPREAEVLYIVTRGITQKECARMCGISPFTVADYVKSGYRKLGVRNRLEAAAALRGQTT